MVRTTISHVVNDCSESVKTDHLSNQFPLHSVAAGRAHRLVVTSEGQPYTWGRNESGQLGLGQDPSFCSRDTISDFAFATIEQPIRIDCFSGHTVEQVWCGGDCSFAWTRQGVLYSWGSNTFGQLGQGHELPQVSSPQTVVGLDCSKLTALACGKTHVLSIVDGVVWAWGRGVHGQLGFGGFVARQTVPRLALNLSVRVSMAAGDGIDDGGGAGKGNANQGDVPLTVACGDAHSAVLTASGRLYTFGSNVYGQLGHSRPVARPRVGPPRTQSAEALARKRRPKAMDMSMAQLEETYRKGGGSLGCRLSKSQLIRYHASLQRGTTKHHVFVQQVQKPRRMIAFGGV